MMPARLYIFIFCLPLAACGGLLNLGPEGPPPEMYTLDPLPRAPGQSASAFRLFVEEPQMSGALDSGRIAVRRGSGRIAYLSGMRWEDRTPRLIQRHVARSLDNRERIEAIGEFNIDMPVAYRLRLDIRSFHMRPGSAGQAPRVEISWVAILMSATSSEVLGNRHFATAETAVDETAGSIVAAYNRAMNDIVRDLALWVERAAAENPSGSVGP